VFGIAEIESLYGKDKIKLVGDKAVIVDVDPCLLAFDRLGGSLKFCKILTELDTTDWKQIERFLVEVSPAQSEKMPEGKMRLGISAIGFSVDIKQLEATGLSMKKAIKKTGRNVRYVPNKELELNAAQVIHNQLAGQTGWEIVLIKDNDKTIVAQTVKVQDIEAYTKRDRERPFRDTRVGMLPPKLAQIIINLAVGKIPEDKLESICDIPAGKPIPISYLNQKILDPFCGTGVVLQEAMLMGYDAYGTDIDKRMIDYATNNAKWLVDNFGVDNEHSKMDIADATQYKWPESFDFVASETYLGRPFTSTPGAEILAQTMSDCNLIIRKFLKNIHGQMKPGTRLCLAVPAWQVRPSELKYLPLIDQIEELGYNRVSFEHIGAKDLVYFRPEQFVARQMLVITRN
jgi:tRNA G10  N-methylase Trm11